MSEWRERSEGERHTPEAAATASRGIVPREAAAGGVEQRAAVALQAAAALVAHIAGELRRCQDDLACTTVRSASLQTVENSSPLHASSMA